MRAHLRIAVKAFSRKYFAVIVPTAAPAGSGKLPSIFPARHLGQADSLQVDVLVVAERQRLDVG